MTPSDYSYLTLDVLNVGDQNYLYAVVKRFEFKNKDSANAQLSLLVTDPSVGFSNSIPCVIHGKPLPDVREKFDIIRMHRASFDTNQCITGSISRHGFHCVVWSGVPGHDTQPRSTTSGTFKYLKHDNTVVRNLRIWSQEQKTKLANDASGIDTLEGYSIDSFSDFTSVGNYGTIVAQVIGLFATKRGFHVLRVWDGTKIVLRTSSMPSSVNKLDLQEDIEITFMFDENLNAETADYSVDVFIYDEHVEQAKELKARDYVKIANLHAFFKTNERCRASITLHGNRNRKYAKRYESRLSKLDPSEPIVVRLKRRMEKLITPNVQRNAMNQHVAAPICPQNVAASTCSEKNTVDIMNVIELSQTQPKLSPKKTTVRNLLQPSVRHRLDQIVENAFALKSARRQQECNETDSTSSTVFIEDALEDAAPGLNASSSSASTPCKAAKNQLEEDENQFLDALLYLTTHPDVLSLDHDLDSFFTPPDEICSQDSVELQINVGHENLRAHREQQTSQPLSERSSLDMDITFSSTANFD